NSPYGPETIWNELPRPVQQDILDKRIKLFVIDASKVARESGMGNRINTIMQTCFFALSNVLPRDEAINQIKQAIERTYAKKGKTVIAQNFRAVDAALANLHPVDIPDQATSRKEIPPAVAA